MLDRLLDLYAPWVGRTTVVVNSDSEGAIRRHCATRRVPIDFVVQAKPTGMLDAILLAMPSVTAGRSDVIWITWADQVAVHPDTVARLAAVSGDPDVAMALPVSHQERPYTFLERDSAGRIAAIRHLREGDALPAEGESEMGLFSVSREAFLTDLPAFDSEHRHALGTATGERNFLPFIPWLSLRKRVVTFPCREEIEAIGVNTPEELAAVEAALRVRGEHA